MAFLVALNVVTMSAGVVFRFVLNFSLGWVDELGAVSLVWITFLGATFSTIENRHLSMPVLMNKFSPKTRLIVSIIVNLLMMFFMYLMIRYGYIICTMVLPEGLSSMPYVSRGVVMSIIPLSGLVMFIFMIVRVGTSIKQLFFGSNA